MTQEWCYTHSPVTDLPTLYINVTNIKNTKVVIKFFPYFFSDYFLRFLMIDFIIYHPFFTTVSITNGSSMVSVLLTWNRCHIKKDVVCNFIFCYSWRIVIYNQTYNLYSQKNRLILNSYKLETGKTYSFRFKITITSLRVNKE